MSIRDKAIETYINDPNETLNDLLTDWTMKRKALRVVRTIYINNWNDDIRIHNRAPFSVIPLSKPTLRTPRGLVVFKKTFWSRLVDKYNSFKASLKMLYRMKRAHKAFLRVL